MSRQIRNLPLPLHGALEFGAGLAMMIAPPLLSFSILALIVSEALGAILVGTALGLTATRDTSVTSHKAFDSAFVVVTAVAALALAIMQSGQASAVVFLAAIVVALTAVRLVTRPTAP